MRQSPGNPSRWQIWYFNQENSRAHTDPKQPTDESKKERTMLVLSDINAYQKIICAPVQDIGNGAGLTEVELNTAEYPTLIKDSKVLCHEIYTLNVRHFTRMVCAMKDAHRVDVANKVKRVLRL